MKNKKFWQSYLDTLPASHQRRLLALPPAWSFGADASMANDLLDLVISGDKTATCSRYWGKNILNDGGLSILLDGNNEPKCLVDTYEITIKPFNQVDATFAKDEGEGDGSLAYWQQVHWVYFSAEAGREKHSVSQGMLLSCERFEVLFCG